MKWFLKTDDLCKSIQREQCHDPQNDNDILGQSLLTLTLVLDRNASNTLFVYLTQDLKFATVESNTWI